MDVSYPVRRRYFGSRRSHLTSRRVGTITNRQYFDAFQVDGRALLRGTQANPISWLADLDGRLFICSENAMGARHVQDDAKVPASAIYDVGANHAIH